MLKDIIEGGSNFLFQRPRGNNKGGLRENKSPAMGASSWTDNVHVVTKEKSYAITASMANGLDSRDIAQNEGKRQIVFVDKSQTIPATIYKENAKSMLKRNKKGLLVFMGGLEKGRRLHDGKNLSRNFREGSRIYSTEGKSAALTAQPKGGEGGYSGFPGG